MNAVYIVNNVYNNCPLSERKELLEKEFPEFVQTYPVLAEMICKPRFNIYEFNRVLLDNTNKKRKRVIYDEDIESVPEIINMFTSQRQKEEYLV